MKQNFILYFFVVLGLYLNFGKAQTITIDGNFNDWNSINYLAQDYMGDANPDTADLYRLYVYDDNQSIYIRIQLYGNGSFKHPTNYGFYGDFHIFISVDPDNDSSDNTGLRYGGWTNGYDFLCTKGWWSQNFKVLKYNGSGNDWEWQDSNWVCNVAYNLDSNDVEIGFPKNWLRYPNISNFPETGVGKLAIKLAANRGFEPYAIADTLIRPQTNFGGFIYTLNSPLPVELTTFTAIYKGKNKVELRWSTAIEVNNYGFEIERAFKNNFKNKLNWERIGFVNGNGNSNSPRNYSYIDENVYYGTYIYRLKQIDIDGSFKYSDYVEVNTGKEPEKAILEQNYPNPFNPMTLIKFLVSENELATLKVYNIMGEEVATLFNDIAEANKIYKIKFNADNLPSGMYIYKLKVGDFVKTNKMILVK